MSRLQPGDTGPGFTLSAADGTTVSSNDLRGQPTVLYFYPAADTPGCTTQACDFRDNIASLSSHGYQVVGVSPDPPPVLAAFAEIGYEGGVHVELSRHSHDAPNAARRAFGFLSDLVCQTDPPG